VKVCYISNFLPGYHRRVGGADYLTLRFARAARKRGHEISFIVTKSVNQFKKTVDGFPIFPVTVIEDLFPRNIKKIIGILKWYIFQFDPIVYFSVKQLLHKLKPDIIHLHSFYLLTFAVVAAARREQIPVCVSIYDYWMFCPQMTLTNTDGKPCRRIQGARCVRCLPKKLLLIQKMLLYFREPTFRYFLDKIDSFVVLSRNSASILEDMRIPFGKIMVVNQPGDMSLTVTEIRAKPEHMILYVGWIEKRKGLHIIIEAMPEIVRKFNDARLFVIGDIAQYQKSYYKNILIQINQLGLGKYVFITGPKPYKEIKEFLSKADVVVIPEQWENMSPVILTETMLAGKCIVASRIGGIPEFIKDGYNGLLAEPQSPSSFASKIIEILVGDKQGLFSKRARTDAMTFFREQDAGNKLSHIYSELQRRI